MFFIVFAVESANTKIVCSFFKILLKKKLCNTLYTNYLPLFQKCIEYSLDVGHVEIDSLISKLIAKKTLSAMQRAHLSKLIGTENYIKIENSIESVNNS